MSPLCSWGFPAGLDGKESAFNEIDLSSIPGLGRSPGKGMQPTSVLLPGEFHGHSSLTGYSSWGCRESDTIEQLILSLIFSFTLSIHPVYVCVCT